MVLVVCPRVEMSTCYINAELSASTLRSVARRKSSLGSGDTAQ